MALIDRKVGDWSQSVSSLDDKPQMTASDLKAAFDSNSNQLKPAINGIIDDLIAQDAAAQIGAVTSEGQASNVQAELQKIKSLIISGGASDEVLNQYLKKLDAEQTYVKKTQLDNFYIKTETLADNTKTLFGLDVGAVPDAVFNKIKTLIDSANSNANGKAKIQTGSYIGTGTYGQSNPNVLNFNFKPQIVFVSKVDLSNGRAICKFYAVQGALYASSEQTELNYAYGECITLTWTNNSLSFWGQWNIEQCNESGATYNYIAIG